MGPAASLFPAATLEGAKIFLSFSWSILQNQTGTTGLGEQVQTAQGLTDQDTKVLQVLSNGNK